MTVRIRSHLRRAATAVTVTAALTIGSASARAPGIDWNAVGQAMGTTPKTEPGDVHTAGFLRTDLHVVNAGVTENPGMELGAEAMFHPSAPGTVVVIGEATLTAQETNKVAARLDQGNVEVTAIHKHLQDESPRLWWLHYAAYGDPVAIARTLHAALAFTGIPLHPAAEKNQRSR